jgi:hypothetical protein
MSSESAPYFVQCTGCGEERAFTTPEERNLFAVRHPHHGVMVYQDPKTHG